MRQNSKALLCAAGGIADRRGLAAAMMLGADGAVVGTRLWASSEALVYPRILENALKTTGDHTLRTRVLDVVRGYDWPARYSGRVLCNPFVQKWYGAENALKEDAGPETGVWSAGQQSGDPDVVTTFASEGIGLINSAPAACHILAALAGAKQALAYVPQGSPVQAE